MAAVRRVLILYTGGTFGMRPETGNETRYRVARLSGKVLKDTLSLHVPEIQKIARCDIEIFCNLDSSHIGPKEWIRIAERVRTASRAYDGIVLLHGTDTLAYTASALTLLLPKLSIPVVLTGAQRPLYVLRTDARRNLVSAVEIASRRQSRSLNRVLVFFDDQLLLGSAVRKISATRFHGFDSPRFPMLAEVGAEVMERPGVNELKRLKSSRRASLEDSFSERVLQVNVTPGFPAFGLRLLAEAGLDGVLLNVFPSGTAPTHDPHFIAGLKHLRKRGLPVVLATEGYGDAAPTDTYSAAQPLLKEGCHWAGGLTPECAYVLTSYILGQKDGRKRFKAYFESLSRELPA